MSSAFGKRFAELVAQTLELQELERQLEERRATVARMQQELEAAIGNGTRVSVPMVRAVQ